MSFFVQILHNNHSCACALTGRVAILAAREGGEAIKANKIATSEGSVPTSTCHTGRGERPPGIDCPPGGALTPRRVPKTCFFDIILTVRTGTLLAS